MSEGLHCNGTRFAVALVSLFKSRRHGAGGRAHFKYVEETMKKLRRLWVFVFCCALLPALASSPAQAAGGSAQPIAIVADTRFIENGLLHWWAQMYNESHLTFAIMTMFIIPVLGCVLGVVADFFMKMTGINLEKRELAEK
jgi:hypothetical protein